MLGLESKRAVVLNEWRFDEAVLRLPTQLLWLEGRPVVIARPQNVPGQCGHLPYEGSAPIVVTTKEKYLDKLMHEAERVAATQEASESTMLLRRLRMWRFHRKLILPPQVTIAECPHCFAFMLLHHAAACGPCRACL